MGSSSDPFADAGCTVSYLICTLLLLGSCEMPLMAATEANALEVGAGIPLGCRELAIWKVASTPPVKPTIRIAEASAGENRICRSHSTGSKTQRRQPDVCSAVSSASCSRMRAAATSEAEGSSCGSEFISL